MAEIQAPKPQWRVDIIVSVSAMLVSLATFGIYLYQTKIIHEQARASVYPHLEIVRGYGMTPVYFTLSVKNVGIGPAFLKSIEIEYKGKIYRSRDFKVSCLPGVVIRDVVPEDKLPYFGNGGTAPMVLPAGEKEVFVTLGSLKEEDVKTLVNIFDNAKIKICYASVYKNYWTVLKDDQPIECKNCENEDLFKPIKK